MTHGMIWMATELSDSVIFSSLPAPSANKQYPIDLSESTRQVYLPVLIHSVHLCN